MMTMTKKILLAVFEHEKTKELINKCHSYTLSSKNESGFRVFYNYLKKKPFHSKIVKGDKKSCPTYKAEGDSPSVLLLSFHTHPPVKNSKEGVLNMLGCDISRNDFRSTLHEYYEFKDEWTSLYEIVKNEPMRLIPPIGIRIMTDESDHTVMQMYQFFNIALDKAKDIFNSLGYAKQGIFSKETTKLEESGKLKTNHLIYIPQNKEYVKLEDSIQKFCKTEKFSNPKNADLME